MGRMFKPFTWPSFLHQAADERLYEERVGDFPSVGPVQSSRLRFQATYADAATACETVSAADL